MSNYQIIVLPHRQTTIAIAQYRGRSVRAIAKLNPKDTWNEATGAKLASARLDLKLNEKRKKAAEKRMLDLEKEAVALKARLEQLQKMHERTQANFEDLCDQTADIEREIAELSSIEG